MSDSVVNPTLNVIQALAASCADSSQAVAVYRDFNDGLGNHFYTVSTPLLSAESHVSLMSFILSPKKQH
jgi:hypothetical protein